MDSHINISDASVNVETHRGVEATIIVLFSLLHVILAIVSANNSCANKLTSLLGHFILFFIINRISRLGHLRK